MTNTIKINNSQLQVKEYNGQRVVTFKDIDQVHNRPEGTARKRFIDNKQHFVEGEDYYHVLKSEKRTIGFEAPNRGIVVLTESGYLMLVKSFTDDLAWAVQRQLVNSYFKVESKSEYPVKSSSLGEVTNFLKLMDKIMVAQGSSPYKRAQAFEHVGKQFGVELPTKFVEPTYEQAVLTTTVTHQLMLR